MQRSDTIAAIATAPGRGGIGVIRVSGPKAPDQPAPQIAEIGAESVVGGAKREAVRHVLELLPAAVGFLPLGCELAGEVRIARSQKQSGRAALFLLLVHEVADRDRKFDHFGEVAHLLVALPLVERDLRGEEDGGEAGHHDRERDRIGDPQAAKQRHDLLSR